LSSVALDSALRAVWPALKTAVRVAVVAREELLHEVEVRRPVPAAAREEELDHGRLARLAVPEAQHDEVAADCVGALGRGLREAERDLDPVGPGLDVVVRGDAPAGGEGLRDGARLLEDAGLGRVAAGLRDHGLDELLELGPVHGRAEDELAPVAARGDALARRPRGENLRGPAGDEALAQGGQQAARQLDGEEHGHEHAVERGAQGQRDDGDGVPHRRVRGDAALGGHGRRHVGDADEDADGCQLARSRVASSTTIVEGYFKAS
jgi:hypothetical protein